MVYSNTGITGLKLFKVTKVNNKELNKLMVEEDENLQIDPKNIILKILTSPEVKDFQNWPFEFFKSSLFAEVST